MVTTNRITGSVNLPDINLDNILSIDHRRIGLHLAGDDHTITLFKNGAFCKSWNTQQVKIVTIHEEADKYLGSDAVEALQKIGGIEFGRN